MELLRAKPALRPDEEGGEGACGVSCVCCDGVWCVWGFRMWAWYYKIYPGRLLVHPRHADTNDTNTYPGRGEEGRPRPGRLVMGRSRTSPFRHWRLAPCRRREGLAVVAVVAATARGAAAGGGAGRRGARIARPVGRGVMCIYVCMRQTKKTEESAHHESRFTAAAWHDQTNSYRLDERGPHLG